MNGILIVAHAPLASALRACVLHVFPDAGDAVAALDVLPDMSPEDSLAQARSLLRQSGQRQTLVVTDVFGATPCNVAQRLVDGVNSKLLTGVNLPMLVKLARVRAELPLKQAVERAQEAGRKYINIASLILGS